MFDPLRRIRPAARGGFPELLYLPKLLGSLFCPHDLAYLRKPFPRSVGSMQFIWPDEFQLPRYQRLAELYGAKRISARNDYMLKSLAEITRHSLKISGCPRRNLLTGHRLPSTIGQYSGVQACSLSY